MKTKSGKKVTKANNVKNFTSRKERRHMKMQQMSEIKNKKINKKYEQNFRNHKFVNVNQPIRPKPKLYPWQTDLTQTNSGIYKLHHEIYDFYKYIIPKEKENIKRQETIKVFSELIEKRWPGWKVKIFGSFPVNLHLSDSDIDMVVFNESNRAITDTQQLYLIYDHIQRSRLCIELRFVDARVPIVKVKTINGIDIDIS